MRSVILGLTLWLLCTIITGPAWAQAAAKARLQIDKMPAGTLDLAVFDAGASSFDQPLVFVHGVSPAGVEIPPGDLLVVLRLNLFGFGEIHALARVIDFGFHRQQGFLLLGFRRGDPKHVLARINISKEPKAK